MNNPPFPRNHATVSSGPCLKMEKSSGLNDQMFIFAPLMCFRQTAARATALKTAPILGCWGVKKSHVSPLLLLIFWGAEGERSSIWKRYKFLLGFRVVGWLLGPTESGTNARSTNFSLLCFSFVACLAVLIRPDRIQNNPKFNFQNLFSNLIKV